MSNEAFEKWATKHIVSKRLLEFNILKCENGMYKSHIMQRKFEAWQAAKADSELEIAKLKDKINDLEKEEALLNKWLDNNKLWFDESEKEKAQLQANINDLREALEEIRNDSFVDSWQCKLADESLSKTPAQSIQEHDNDLIEKCAIVCELALNMNEFANEKIRALKGKL